MADTDNMLISEHLQILAKIDAASYTVAQNMAWTSAAGNGRFAALIQVGAMTATATLDAKLQMAKDASGTGAIDIPGKAITQMLAASDSNKLRMIELKSDEITDTYTHIRLVLTPATAASIVGAVLLGEAANYRPVPKPAYLAVTN